MPDVFAAGVPLRMPVAGLKVTNVGSVPLSESVGGGLPVAVTVNDPGLPRKKAVLASLVIAGGIPCTVSVKFCTASAPKPLLAVKVSEYVPGVLVGVPLRMPVAGSNVTSVGSVPLSV